MKKLVIISTLIATFAGSAAFGQGYFNFQGTKSAVWDGFTNPTTAQRTSNVDVAFLWAVSGTPAVDAIMSSVSNLATQSGSTWTAAAAWTAILTDPTFTLAHNANDSTVAVAQTLTSGGFQYGLGQFPVMTTTPGASYVVFEIGWNAALGATPAAAALANASVGWSGTWTYAARAGTDTPVNMAAPAQWGVAGIVPEPTTIALTGLGALSLLLIRRKK